MTSPFDLIRNTGPRFSEKIIDNYFSVRVKSLPQKELADYKEYMKLVLLRPASTDNALFICFGNGGLLFPYNPLHDDHKLGGLKMPMSFFFGDRDWMKKSGSDHVLTKNPYTGLYSHMHIIPNSDHHLYFDNPQGLVDAILKDLQNVNDMKL